MQRIVLPIYIKNPVRAGIVDVATDWEFSSALDYAGMRYTEGVALSEPFGIAKATPSIKANPSVKTRLC